MKRARNEVKLAEHCPTTRRVSYRADNKAYLRPPTIFPLLPSQPGFGSTRAYGGANAKKRSGVSSLRGVTRLQIGDYNGAKAELRKTIERDPDGICGTLARKRLEPFCDDQEIADSTVRGPV
jgi:hypothetical protein